MKKKQLYITTLFVSILFFNSTILSAQRIDSLLNILDTRFPQEKIYLHTDKAYYNAGETIWFKAYLIADNLPSAISKTLYAELINDKGLILQRRMMPILQSGAASSFDLADTTKDTKLFVRAYTSWMLNFDSSLLYVKPIQIIPAKVAQKKTAPTLTYSLQFFPEGGYLVNNISSRLAFKATNSKGEPAEIKGDIMDGKSKKIVSLSSIHDGMGYCDFTPLKGEKYKAIWKDKKGIAHETILPEAKMQGLTVSATLSSNQLFYTLTRTDSVNEDFTSFNVVAQMGQRLVYSARINMTRKTTVTAPIETDSLPNGVLHLTIFNAAEVPVAERLVFVNHDNYSFITDLHSGDKNLGKRGRNTVQIDVGDKLLANLSISITDAGLNPVTKNEESIYSQLLLSSDVRGYVYNAAYYFSNNEDSVKEHFDLVMMTNGWRRFKWDEVLAEKWPVVKNIPENYLTINGKAIGLNKNLLYQKDITGILKTKNGSTNVYIMPVNSKGEFFKDNLFFFDTAKLYYQFSNDKDKTITSLASYYFKNNYINATLQNEAGLAGLYATEKIDSSILLKSNTMAGLQRSQNEMNRVKTLQTVEIKTKVKSLKEVMDKEYTSGLFSGGDGYTFTTEDDPFAKSSPSVLAYLQGKVAGLQISTNGAGEASWRGSATSLFLNEITSDVQAISSINMADVALIKVYRPPFFGATGGGAGGAIAIYTKKGSNNNSQVTGLPFTLLYGYSPIKEFYSPDYEKNAEPDIKDYRTTLYWNPTLYFDKNTRRMVIPFFNSDNCKKIRVTIEGINEAGQLTREEKIIE